jgi:hypothetical protein
VFWEESLSKALPCKVIDSGQCTSDNKLENSKTLGKNRHGALLLDLCKGNNTFILNGRLNGDKDGNFTCKGTSVVFRGVIIQLSGC